MYAVQIESLEEFQRKLTVILQDIEANNAGMTAVTAVNSMFGGGDSPQNFGSFPEARSFAAAYAQAKQELVTSFNEVTQLVNTMISVVGANATKYKQTEADIQAKFNAILQQYGDAPTSSTTYSPQSYSYAPTTPPTPATNTPQTTTPTTGATPGAGSL